MLKGKQRAYLRSIANTLKPSTQIGKDGVTESFLDQLDDMLRKREIVKVTILETAGLETKETANAICEALRAEFVQAIGSKFTLYKKNTEKKENNKWRTIESIPAVCTIILNIVMLVCAIALLKKKI